MLNDDRPQLALDLESLFIDLEQRGSSPTLGLRLNPFPPTGIRATGDFAGPYLMKSTWLPAIEEFFRAALAGSDFAGLVMLGQYGSGKTSLLKYLEDAVNTAQARGVPMAAYYVSNPGASFADVLQSVVQAIGRETLTKYGWGFVFQQLRHVSPETWFGVPIPEAVGERLKFVADPHEFWEIARDQLLVPEADIGRKVLDSLYGALEDGSFVEQLGQLMLGSRASAALTWTSLTRPLPSASSKKPAASQRLDSLLIVLSANGIRRMVILIDELEDVFFNQMTTKVRREFTASIRTLSNRVGGSVAIVLASNLPGWAAITRTDPGLDQRFRFKIELSELTGDDIRRMILIYLREGRDESFGNAWEQFGEHLSAAMSQLNPRWLPRTLTSASHTVVEHFWSGTQQPSSAEILDFLRVAQ